MEYGTSNISLADHAGGMKKPLILSVILHAVILLFFGIGMGLQGGGPSGVEIIFVSLESDPGPISNVQDPGSDIQGPGSKVQDPRSRNQERGIKADRSIFDMEGINPDIEEQPSHKEVDIRKNNKQPIKTSVNDPRVSDQEYSNSVSVQKNQEPGTRNQELGKHTEPIAVTAFAGNNLPTGILNLGSGNSDALVSIPSAAISLPRPTYPLASRKKGEEGTVTFSFLVYKDGTVGQILVVRSSGYQRLDKAAGRSLRSAVFLPASENGISVTSSRKIAFSFKLED